MNATRTIVPLFLLSCAAGALGQKANPYSNDPSFHFKPEQSVYVVRA